MPTSGEIVSWIEQLADSDPNKRTAAAGSLCAAALELCFSESNDWIGDPDFRELLHFTEALRVNDSNRASVPFVAGIAVTPANFEKIRIANGSPHLAEVPPDQDAMEFELHFADAGELDILTTRDRRGSGAIARYLQKFGEGIQQVEVNVTDVGRATELLKTRFGLAPIYPETRAGADGTRVNFFLAPAAKGKKCLIELVEAAPK